MAQMDISFPPLAGELAAEIVDPSGVSPVTVVYNDVGFQVHCHWHVDPPAGSMLGGTWGIQLIAEGLGSAIEGQTFVNSVVIDGRETPPDAEYEQTFSIANLPLGGQPSILLELGVALTYRDTAGDPGPIAAFLDLGVIQVYKEA